MTRREKLIRQVRAHFARVDEPKQIKVVKRTARGYLYNGKNISENTLAEMKKDPRFRIVVLQKSKPLMT